jgi:uncharacterized small protein (DUF1192 family)
MNDDEDRRPIRSGDLTVPARLDHLSVDEMTDLRDRLRVEIDRLEREISKRLEVRRAADALFKQRLD